MIAIGELASRAGVSVRSVRHYESEGLVEPVGRCANGYRVYSHAAVQRVRQVKALVDNGVPLRMVKELLPHLEPRALVPSAPCDYFMAQLDSQRSKLAIRIARLTEQYDALGAYREMCAKQRLDG